MGKSFNSPKNRFHAEITYNNALDGIGGVSSIGADTIEEIKAIIWQHYSQNIHNAKGATIRIVENEKTYPDFSWVFRESYSL